MSGSSVDMTTAPRSVQAKDDGVISRPGLECWVYRRESGGDSEPDVNDSPSPRAYRAHECQRMSQHAQ